MPKQKLTQRADGRYSMQIYLCTVDGKRKYKTVYGKTPKECQANADEVRRQLNKGFVVDNIELFGEWRKLWLAQRKQELTESEYKTTLARSEYFKELDRLPVAKILPYQIQSILDDISVSNPRTKKPTAKKTLKNIKNIAVRIFDYAISNRVAEFNPAEQTKIDKNAPQTERRALTSQEIKWIEETDHRAKTAAMIMLYAGLRRGEVTALTWNDIDFIKNTITVNKSFDFKSNKSKSPKTKAGTRVIPMPDKLSEYLGKIPRTSLLVVTTANNKMMTHTAWRSMWQSYIKELNFLYGEHAQKSKFDPHGVPITIQEFTPHCLRHTYCTMLYDAGVDVLTAKYLMGHSDVKTTLGIYTHLSDQKKEYDVQKLNDYISNNHQIKKAD